MYGVVAVVKGPELVCPEDRQGAVHKINAATARLLTLVKPAEI